MLGLISILIGLIFVPDNNFDAHLKNYLDEKLNSYVKYEYQILQMPKEHFRVVSLIDHAINLIDHTLKNHSIRIENEHVYNPTLYTYRNEVLQVLIVLLKNSLDAFMENKVIGGEIIIAVRHEESYCVIEICDNAGGIPKEVMYKLFSPYFTTKSESFGTGLGLYMSRIIIEDHCAGLIQALSEGNRTTFSVKLPYEEEQ